MLDLGHEVQYSKTHEDLLYGSAAFAGVYAGANALSRLGAPQKLPGMLALGAHGTALGSNFLLGMAGNAFNLTNRTAHKMFGNYGWAKQMMTNEGMNLGFLNFRTQSVNAFNAAGGYGSSVLPGINVSLKGQMAKHLDSTVDFTADAVENIGKKNMAIDKKIAAKNKTLKIQNKMLDRSQNIISKNENILDNYVKNAFDSQQQLKNVTLDDFEEFTLNSRQKIKGQLKDKLPGFESEADELVDDYLKKAFDSGDPNLKLSDLKTNAETMRSDYIKNASSDFEGRAYQDAMDDYMNKAKNGDLSLDDLKKNAQKYNDNIEKASKTANKTKNRISRTKDIITQLESEKIETFSRQNIIDDGAKAISSRKLGKVTAKEAAKQYGDEVAEKIVANLSDDALLKYGGKELAGKAIASDADRALLQAAAKTEIGRQVATQARNAAFAKTVTGRSLSVIGTGASAIGKFLFSAPVQTVLMAETALNLAASARTNNQVRNIKEYQGAKQAYFNNPATQSAIQKGGAIYQNNNNDLNFLLSSPNVATQVTNRR